MTDEHWVVPAPEHRCQYMALPDGKVIAYSRKVGSTSLTKMHSPYAGRLTQPQAREWARERKEVLLYVRHPLDRLVSAWKFFTTVQRAILIALFQRDDELMAPHMPFEEWARKALAFANPHWYPQSEYHTNADGEFIPNRIVDLQHLKGPKLNVSRRRNWEEYYSDQFREQVEAIYLEDLALYKLARSKGPEGIIR